jgi:nucleoside-diphosphate-sugar epimerase
VTISTLSSFLVTGAAGCVGRMLLERLDSAGVGVVGLDLAPPPRGRRADAWVRGNILEADGYEKALRGIDSVSHLAAKAHSVPRTIDEAERFWRVNLEGTRTLMGAAVKHGVRRFVHVSTVAVLSPSIGGPASAYADSKRAAEAEALGFGGRIEVVVVRPSTVYGPNDRGNVYKLIRWVDRGFPAIVGSGDNRKSLVYERNLADALLFLSEHGKNGDAYTVTDGRDLSMREIVLGISQFLGRGNRLSSIPPGVVKVVAEVNERLTSWFGLPTLFGREMIEKLTGEMVFDPSALFSLGFAPMYSFEAGMEETVRWYKRSVRSRSV